jgi:formylglycine-generating enzyme required for sulfatase activity
MERELSESQVEARKLTESYKSRLQTLSDSYQERGDLAGLLAVKEEIEKPGGTETTTHPELASLRQIYKDALPAAQEKDRQHSRRVLTDSRSKFETLTTQWTKNGELELATKSLEASKRIAATLLDLSKLSLVTKKSFPNRYGGRPGESCTDGFELVFRWIPPGSFKMGSPLDELHRNPKREELKIVELSRGFWLSQHEITQAQFAAIMGEHRNSNKGDAAVLPVEEVTWEQAAEFCRKLTERERAAERLSDRWMYALPSEHQWEYACRSGESGPTSGGTLDEVAWTMDNSEKRTQPVGTKAPNAWGLHDMLGNVWEWTSSPWADQPGSGKDPAIQGDESSRAIRGSSVKGGPQQTRAAHRDARKKTFQWNDLGLRPALVPAQ